MAIEIGAKIIAIVQTSQTYMAGDPPEAQTLYIRNVSFETVGMPVSNPPAFTLAVTDATQWDMLQVGKTYTVSIAEPAE